MLSNVQEWGPVGPSRVRDGNQTLARGLRVFLAIADSDEGMTVQQVGDLLGVHRSIAYRVLQTLLDFGLVARSNSGVYYPGARLATLSQAYLPVLREAATPVMQDLANRLESTISLFVEQGDDAIAIAMVEPTTTSHHIAFRPGMRTPLNRGAAGYAMLALGPKLPGEPSAVDAARDDGYARSHGEIENGAYGVAAAIVMTETTSRASLNLITYRSEIAESAGPDMKRAADDVARLLAAAG